MQKIDRLWELISKELNSELTKEETQEMAELQRPCNPFVKYKPKKLDDEPYVLD